MKQMQNVIAMVTLPLAISLTVAAHAQSAPGVAKTANDAPNVEAAAIRQAALDYIEGWYEGNGERMERALHPELAKRIVQTDPKTGRSTLGQQSALTLVQRTRGRAAKPTPKEQQQKAAFELSPAFQRLSYPKLFAFTRTGLVSAFQVL